MPLTPGEAYGSRVARARSLMDQLEFEEALGLLVPLHDAPELPPTLGIEAALLETNALMARQDAPAAAEACRRAVRLAGYDPGVGRDQAPRVQAVCRTAAEQARAEWVQARHLRLDHAEVSTAAVAWNPIRVGVHVSGEVQGLVVEIEVRIDNREPLVVNLQPTDAGFAASLDANLATPGARVVVAPRIRDAFGVLVPADTRAELTIPTDEAAVRFAPGTDEGPLRIDGRPSSYRGRVGATVPLPLGQHTIEIAAQSGPARSAINLRRGEIALLTVHSEAVSNLLGVLRWGSTAGSVVILGTGGVFYFLAVTAANQLTGYATQARDPATGLPQIQYGDVEAVDSQRVTNRNIAIGFGIGGAVLATVAIVAWALPDSRPQEQAPTARPQVRIEPTGSGLALRF